MRLEYMDPADLEPNGGNWRAHPQAQLVALKDVVAEVGWAGALLWNERTKRLVDGHARRELFAGQKVPVLVGSWTEEQERKILATLDPLAAMAEADAAKLAALLTEIDTESEAVQSLLDSLAQDNPTPLPKPGAGGDEFDATPQAGSTRTQPGDVWLIGGVHRLLVGDCTDAGNLVLLMNGATASLCLTDPPYGIGIAANPVRQKHQKSDWDDTPASATAVQMCLDAAPAVIVWGGNYFGLPASQGFYVWDKKQPEEFSLAMCEMAWTNLQSPAKMYRESVTSYLKEHPTQKPIGLMMWCIEKSQVEGIILDPFLGSGTTLIAAHRLGRVCYGCEIECRYADVILKRAEAEGLSVERIGQHATA